MGRIVAGTTALTLISHPWIPDQALRRRTPDPPALSAAFNITVTFVLFQPELGVGETELVVVGGIEFVAPGYTIKPFWKTVTVSPAAIVTSPLSGPQVTGEPLTPS